MISGRLLLWILIVLLLLSVPSLLIYWLTSGPEISFEDTRPPPAVHEKPAKKREIAFPEEVEDAKIEEVEEVTTPEPEPEPEMEEPKESMDLVPAVRSAGILPPRVSGPLLPAVPGQAIKTELKMRILGTLVINDGTDSRSSALIAVGGGASKTYFPGQEIGDGAGLKLVRVGQDRVEFLNQGRLEFATLSRSMPGGSSSPSISDREIDRESARGRREEPSDLTEDAIFTPERPVDDQEERTIPPGNEEKSDEQPTNEEETF